MTWRALDLCAGACGGWSLGLKRAGIEPVAACESVDWRRELLAENHPGAVIYDDIRTLTGAQVRADLGFLPDFIAGSPPCKEYSPVGRGGGLSADDLFTHAVRLVDECRPRWCAFENSAFLKTRGYDRIADALEAIGYTCWPLVVGAGNAGATHRRSRVFVVASDLSRPQGRPAGLPRPAERLGALAGAVPDALLRDVGHARKHLPSLGPAGSEPLGRHLREYDGLPAGLSERCREAYGDSVLPQLTEAVGRAILATDAELARLAA